MEIDWSTEWLTSLLWVGKVFAAVLAGFVAAGWLLIRRTRWGRQFWRLAGGFFVPKERTYKSWRPLLTVALLLLLTVIGVRIDVVLSYWNNGLFTALQELDESAFWSSMIIFGVLAAIYIVYALFNFYVVQAQIIHWRQWLNQHMVDDWLKGAAYHRGRFVKAPVDNPDQRIQQDVTSFASISQDLALGVVSAMVTLVSFTIILWQLSGPLTLLGITIPRGLVFLTFIFMIIATVIAFRIGRPLIRLNFLQEAFGASYRYSLVRVRENSENVAFYRGEAVENAGLFARFTFVIINAWDLVYRNLKFQGFNFVVSQITVVLPYILQARRFFSQQITLGDFTQSASAFSSGRRRAVVLPELLRHLRVLQGGPRPAHRAARRRRRGAGAAQSDHRGDGVGAADPRPGRTAARRSAAAHRSRHRARCRGLAADQGAVGHGQDHAAAQPGRDLAARRRGDQPAGQ